MQELVPAVKDLHGGDSCTAKQILELAVNTVCERPVQLSKPQEFCWAVVAHCCGLIFDKVKCEEFGWLTSYKYTVEKIAKVYDTFAPLQRCPPSQLSSYKIYMQCVKEIQSIPKRWNQKLKLNDVTYDEILLYLENFNFVFQIASDFNITEFTGQQQQIAEESKKEFNTQFRLLSSYLVPSLETHPVPMW